MFSDARPYVRWWWFSGPLEIRAIDEQLDWIASHGFGGVEIAWVYPRKDCKAEEGPRFLDEQFQYYVEYTIRGCKKRNLGCDLTFGTLWPFSGTFIPEQYGTKTLTGEQPQTVDRSWEARYASGPARVLDHLDEKALTWYASHLLEHGFEKFCTIAPLSLFCDSWEVETHNLGFNGFAEAFLAKFGYSYDPKNNSRDQRFDYRCLISQRVLTDFYQPFSTICHQVGATSRVQCHGAPTDMLAAYALVDIPESETLLFDPDFSLLAASAAAMEHKRLVSSETFSCIYGWVPNPATPPGLKAEKIDDLRCVADAQFAWGVNRVVWHGKPYETLDNPNEFYATVHVGPNSALQPYLLPFNAYLATLSEFLSKGEAESRLSILLPLEDQWMQDELPQQKQKPSSRFYWELQELKIPDELLVYRPLWFSPLWLKDLVFAQGLLRYKHRTIDALLCQNEWLTFNSLKHLLELKNLGAPIYFTTIPMQPGTNKHPQYESLTATIRREFPTHLKPLLKSSQPLDFWCRRQDDRYFLFISHPGMRKLRYPLLYDYASTLKPIVVEAVFSTQQNAYALNLEFPRCGSLAFEIDDMHMQVRSIPLPSSFQ